MSTPTPSQADQALPGARSSEGPSRVGGGHMEPSDAGLKDEQAWLDEEIGRVLDVLARETGMIHDPEGGREALRWFAQRVLWQLGR